MQSGLVPVPRDCCDWSEWLPGKGSFKSSPRGGGGRVSNLPPGLSIPALGSHSLQLRTAFAGPADSGERRVGVGRLESSSGY